MRHSGAWASRLAIVFTLLALLAVGAQGEPPRASRPNFLLILTDDHGCGMRRNAEVIDPDGHATDLFSDWAVDHLRQRARTKEQPFFL